MHNPYFYLFKYYRQFVEKKRMVVVFFFFFFCANMVAMFEPYFVGKLINTLQVGGENLLYNVIVILIILGCIPLVFWIFHGTARVREEKIKFQVNKSFKETMFHYTTSLPLPWHNDHHSGETIDQFNKANDALRDFAGSNFMYIQTVMRFVTSIVMLVWIWPLGGSVICIVGFGTFVIVWKFDQIIIPLQKQQNRSWHRVSSALFDYLSNIKTIITLRCEAMVEKVLSGTIETVRQPFNRYSVINERKWFSVNMILAMITAVTIGLYVYNEVAVGATIMVGTIAMLYQYIQRLSESFYQFAGQYSKLVVNKTNFQTVEHIMSAYDIIVAKKEQGNIEQWKNIDIRDLSFSYAPNKKVIKDISLAIHKGQKIALVGSSGDGKSTLLALLRGLYVEDAVSLSIDGVEYNSLSVLHDIVSLIPQDPEIFEHSIRYNITMGADVPDVVLEKYIKIAAFDGVLETLPHGLDSDIKEKGVNLSGGQKQRLALARGLFLGKDSDILLLDEATSSVDALGEKHIYESLFHSFVDKTIIASVHRLHMLYMFDMIYVVEKGCIVESGNLATILSLNGVAKHMWDNYMLKYEYKK